jgi:hypothetical protein
MGVLNLTQTYSNTVVNHACRNCWNQDWITYKSIRSEAESIQKDIDAAAENEQLNLIPDDHENIRGANYYR